MIKKPVKIQLSEGLDARPIALLVQEASQYSSSVYIEVDQKQVNAKSIMAVSYTHLYNKTVKRNPHKQKRKE